MTQLDDVDGVVLYAAGEPLTQYGVMDLSQPLTYEEGAVGPVRKGLNEFDVDLYLPVGNSRLLAQLPGLHSSDSQRIVCGTGGTDAVIPSRAKRLPEPHTGRYNAAVGTPGGGRSMW